MGEADKAFELLVLFEDSLEGIIYEYNSRYKLLGAENRQGVTCYLDALLFAMFARLGTFEAILYKSFDDEPRKRLACLLRLWVNMLRRGRLITVDIVSVFLLMPSVLMEAHDLTNTDRTLATSPSSLWLEGGRRWQSTRCF